MSPHREEEKDVEKVGSIQPHDFINKHRNKIKEYRNIIIDKWINIEYLINMYFMQSYGITEKHRKNFYDDILHEPYFSTGTKIKIMHSILQRKYGKIPDDIKKNYEHLKQMNKIRDIFAHCRPNYYSDIIKDGIGVLEIKGLAFNPNNKKMISMIDQYKKFDEMYDEVGWFITVEIYGPNIKENMPEKFIINFPGY